MLKLIVNADDLGISEDVNRAIAECFRSRFISSTTLMVNMDHADEGAELARTYGWDERVGLHLNLTSGRPLTRDIRKFRCFCSKDGNFNAAFAKRTFSRLYLTEEEKRAASIEVEAQIRKYLSYGLADKHLDSHHHVHTNAPIWEVVEPLVKAYGIRSVRLTRNMYEKMPLAKRIYKKRFNNRLKKLPITTSDYFGSFKDFLRCGESLPEKSLVEIMVHPMYSDEGVLTDSGTPIEEEIRYLESIRYVQEFY